MEEDAFKYFETVLKIAILNLGPETAGRIQHDQPHTDDSAEERLRAAAVALDEGFLTINAPRRANKLPLEQIHPRKEFYESFFTAYQTLLEILDIDSGTVDSQGKSLLHHLWGLDSVSSGVDYALLISIVYLPGEAYEGAWKDALILADHTGRLPFMCSVKENDYDKGKNFANHMDLKTEGWYSAYRYLNGGQDSVTPCGVTLLERVAVEHPGYFSHISSEYFESPDKASAIDAQEHCLARACALWVKTPMIGRDEVPNARNWMAAMSRFGIPTDIPQHRPTGAILFEAVSLKLDQENRGNPCAGGGAAGQPGITPSTYNLLAAIDALADIEPSSLDAAGLDYDAMTQILLPAMKEDRRLAASESKDLNGFGNLQEYLARKKLMSLSDDAFAQPESTTVPHL